MSRSRLKTKYWILNNFPILYDFKFDPIETYIEESQNMLIGLQSKLNDKYNSWEEKIENGDYPTDYPEAYDFCEEEIMHQAEYGKLLRNSTFVTVYSILEFELLNICLWCRKAGSLQRNPKNMGESGYISNFKKFIETEVSVDLASLSVHWDKIEIFKKIRNSITHELGVIKNPNETIQTYISEAIGIEISEPENEIIMTDNTVLIDFIKTANAFLSGVAIEIAKQK